MKTFSIAKVLLLIAVLASNNMVFSQPLFLKDAPYISMSGGTSTNPIWLTINQSTPSAITVTGAAGGGIVSEAEFNYLKWNISNSSGTYTIPFNDGNGTTIPFSMTISTPGTAGGSMLFSTYHTPLNLTPYATYDGTDQIPDMNLNGHADPPGVDNSANVVKRWWIVDASSYSGGYGSFTNRPVGSLSFSFTSAEQNGLSGPDLIVQPYKYDGTNAQWDPTIGFFGSYTAGTPEEFSTTSDVPAANLYRAWVLVNQDMPLPIQLLSFSAVCQGEKIKLNWATASETNNAYFTIEKSSNAVNWKVLTTVPGAGTINSVSYYSAEDETPYSGTSYYKLKQTDFNGAYTYSNIVPVSCETSQTFQLISVYQGQNNEIVMTFTASNGEQYYYSVFDDNGRLLQRKSGTAIAGFNEIHINLNYVVEGIYMVSLQNKTKYFGRKIFIQ